MLPSVDGDLLDDVYNEDICNFVDEFQEFECDNNEPRNYVAEYIGHKLKLDKQTWKKSNSWISVKGEGKLFEPSDKLIDVCKKCDILFDKFHGKGIRICKDPIEKVQSLIIENHPNLPPHIITYVR